MTEIQHIYPSELDLEDNREFYFALLLTKLITNVYDKRDDFGFNIVNFPHLCGNIPSKPAYGVYIYFPACAYR